MHFCNAPNENVTRKLSMMCAGTLQNINVYFVVCRCTTKNEPFFYSHKRDQKKKKRTSTTPVNIKVKNNKPKTNLLITNPEEQDQNLTAKGTNKIRIGKHIKLSIRYGNIQEYEEDIQDPHLNYRPGS